MAASGIGASDVMTATIAGAMYGPQLLWAVVFGGFLKFVLSEGLARWQLATQSTVLEGWARHLPRWVLIGFAIYIVVWAVTVSGALVTGCGLAIHNLTGGLVPRSWGGLAHGLIALIFIYRAHTAGFQRAMKPLIVVMFVSIAICAAFAFSDPLAVVKGLTFPTVPAGGSVYVLSVIGGIGGSLTLLAYNYLLRDEARTGLDQLPRVRRDLVLAYVFTVVFGMCIILIASRAFHEMGTAISGGDAVSKMADYLGTRMGSVGRWVYSLGFWAAVVASLVGVWQSVPSMMADCHGLLRRLPPARRAASMRTTSPVYRAGLLFMAFASVPFAFSERPLAVVVAFTLVGSLFIPFLAGTLLFLNNSVKLRGGLHRNRPMTNVVLVLVLAAFATPAILETIALTKPSRGSGVVSHPRP